MGVPSMPELLIILSIVVLLFGAKKIPDLAAGIGKGIKNFKKAVKEDENIENVEKKDEEPSENIATNAQTSETTTKS
mgnify:CR=1 FL=1